MALNPDRLLKPVKKLRKLVKKLDNQPTPDEVHDLRTNTRKFEAMFEALALDGQRLGKSVLKDLGRFRKRAGKVRDMDVLTSFASNVRVQGEDECSTQLLEYLGARRKKLAKKLYAEVQRHRPNVRQDLKRTPNVLARHLGKNGDLARGPLRAPNATATAVNLATQLADPPRLGKDNLHPYRLKVKELRNVLQMAEVVSHPKFVDDLGEVKDAIGEWHDWEELVAIGKKALSHGNRCELLAELKRIAQHKYDHALALSQQLRKNYLRYSGPPKKGAASAKIPGEPVWKAIAMLAR
jgi:CHAD domain-containing protein